MRIVIVGAGPAGLEAARAAREAGAETVTLLSAEPILPYYRPRLVALAFGQLEPPAMFMHDADWYTNNRLDLRLNSPVSALDVAGATVQAGGTALPYDALIVACGARPVVPPSRSDSRFVLPLWDHAHAMAVHARLRSGGRLVVIGGGILGLETALRARDAGMQVLIVERMPTLMPAQFGRRASDVLRRRLQAKEIEVRLGRTLVAMHPNAAADGAMAELDDGTTVPCDFALLAIGARPAATLGEQAGLRAERGLWVDGNLQTSAPRVFAAGDVVQFAGVTRCSVREALAQGRIAGGNAVAALCGKPLLEYQPQTAPLTFKSGDFELYAVGHPGDDGTNEVCLDGSCESVLRALIVKDGVTLGVQMIGTREGFDGYAKTVQATPAKEGGHA